MLHSALSGLNSYLFCNFFLFFLLSLTPIFHIFWTQYNHYFNPLQFLTFLTIKGPSKIWINAYAAWKGCPNPWVFVDIQEKEKLGKKLDNYTYLNPVLRIKVNWSRKSILSFSNRGLGERNEFFYLVNFSLTRHARVVKTLQR